MKDDVRTLKWIAREVKRILGFLVLLTAVGLIVSYIGVSLALVSRQVMDAAAGSTAAKLISAFGYLAALILIQLAMQVAYSMLSARAVGRLNVHIKRRLFGQLLTKDYVSISAYHSGELINRLNSDVSIIAGAVIDMIPSGISHLTRIIFSFVVLWMIAPDFALACLIGGPLLLVVSHVYRKKMKALYKKCQETDGKTRSFMQECIQNLLVIKSFGSEDVVTEYATSLQNAHYRYTIRRSNLGVAANIMLFVAANAGFYFALAWGAYKLSLGLLSVGTVFAMTQIMGQVQAPFLSISSILPQYYAMLAASERVIEILELPGETQDGTQVESLNDFSEIVLSKVTFAYDSTAVLDGADFSIKKGEVVAVAGNSGIGKSTLLKLLLGIISPSKGDAYIALHSGERVSLGKGTRAAFAYVPQGNMILSGTIRDNISFFDDRADESRIVQCAKTAGVWDFVAELPDGLDTVIGEKGLGLSEGQVQRIAIARAVYRDAPVILLDEATSALDEKTESQLLANIKDIKDKTCIIVSHRKEAFKICHKAYKIDDGRFKMFS